MISPMEHLRILIKSRGVTQTQLARVLGRDKSAITNLLQGKRQLKAEEVIKIAQFMNISEAEVLGRPAPDQGLSMPQPPVMAPPPPVAVEPAGRVPFLVPPSDAVRHAMDGGRRHAR